MSDRPHYRDPDLTDDVAMQAMIDAANHCTREVLNARRDMLAAGIATSHPMCKVLDSFAACMTYLVRERLITDPLPVIRAADDAYIARNLTTPQHDEGTEARP